MLIKHTGIKELFNYFDILNFIISLTKCYQLMVIFFCWVYLSALFWWIKVHLLVFFLFSRESFPNDLQFTILMRFTVDQTQTPSLKVLKV